MSSQAPNPPASEQPRSSGGRRIRRLLYILGGLAVVVWLGFAAVELVLGAIEGYHGASAASDARNDLSGKLSGGGFLADVAATDLSRAHQHLSASHAHLSSPALTPFTLVPVLGRQLRSARALLGSASTVAATGEQTINRANAVLALPHGPGPARVATLQRLSQVAATAQASIAHLDLGPSQGLLGYLGTQRNKLASDLAMAQDGLGRSAVACNTAANMIATPGQYLVLAGNNAEMRAGSGLFLQAGILTTGGGRIHLGPMQSTGPLSVPEPGVPVGGDLAANWGWLQPGVEWHTVNLTPQYDVSGPLSTQMWQAVAGQRVDGVIGVDIEALHQILTATGPVQAADGTTVSADSANSYLMNGQYQNTSSLSADQISRRDTLGSIAQAAFQAIDSDQVNLRMLATGFARAAQGRHVLVWAAQPAAQAGWEQARVAGQVHKDDVMPAVINRGGNKLDYFLDVSSQLDVHHVSAQRTDFALHIQLHNRTPPGQPRYVTGPAAPAALAGEYVGLFAVNLPGWASRVSIDGFSTYAAAGPEGPTVLRAIAFSVNAGAQGQIVVHFTAAAAHGQLQVLPTARVPAVAWTYGNQNFSDSSPHVVTW